MVRYSSKMENFLNYIISDTSTIFFSVLLLVGVIHFIIGTLWYISVKNFLRWSYFSTNIVIKAY